MVGSLKRSVSSPAGKGWESEAVGRGRTLQRSGARSRKRRVLARGETIVLMLLSSLSSTDFSLEASSGHAERAAVIFIKEVVHDL